MNAQAVCQSFTLIPSNAMDVAVGGMYNYYFRNDCLLFNKPNVQKDI